MALRTAARRVSAINCARIAPRTFAVRPQCRCQTTAATAASNLPQDVKDGIEKEATLSNADPLPDSQTSRLVDDQLQYMVPTYARPPPMFHKGQGCYLWDVENRKYLDFTAGIAVNALGHCDPGMTEALAQQARTLIHTSNLYHNPWTGALSKLLVEKTVESGAMHLASKAFICNSGSEANEAALKFARKVAYMAVDSDGMRMLNKNRLVSFNGSFHGRTYGSLSMTPNSKYQAPFGPMLPHVKYGDLNDIRGLKDLIQGDTAGVIIEPIQGEGGVNVATPEFLIALRERCNKVGAVLIFDEIQCGLGRTGQLWAHANLPKEAHPDILTTAKALGNGFPIGATIVSDWVADRIKIGDHGTTFGGNPLGARVAHYILGQLSDPQLQKEVLAKEQIFRQRFARLETRFPKIVREVRGRGLLLGLQLSKDPNPVVTAARERGLLVITCGKNTLRFVPPLIISEEEINHGMAILEDAFASVFKQKDEVPGTEGQQEMGES